MSSSLVRSTYRRMMKYFLRHWCMEIKCDRGTGTRSTTKATHNSTKKNGQDNCQMTKSAQKKTNPADMDDDDDTIDGISSDAQLEWEHEQGIECSPKIYRKSEQDLLDILLTQSPHSTPSIHVVSNPDFEWDHLFDFALSNHVRCCFIETVK